MSSGFFSAMDGRWREYLAADASDVDADAEGA